MTAETTTEAAEATETPAPLPVLSPAEAKSRGLVTIADLMRLYAASRTAIRAHMRTPDGPQPVAKVRQHAQGHCPVLYDREQAIDHLDASTPQMRSRSPRRTRPGGTGLGLDDDLPPRLIGVRTPTAGQPYVWRDPRRWRGPGA